MILSSTCETQQEYRLERKYEHVITSDFQVALMTKIDSLDGYPYESIGPSPFRDVAIVAKARRQIDKRLANLTTLKTYRNALAPISRLPPELLSTIFMYVSRIGVCIGGNLRLYDWEGCPVYFRRDMTWMKVTRVCRYWRTVALQCPMLWAHLSLSDYHLTRKMIRRSQNLPIYLLGDLSNPISSRVTQSAHVALEHLSRIRALQICAPYTRLRRIFSKMIGPAPLLESLFVTTYDRDEDGFTLPAHLFHGNLPQLRRITLSRCNLDWDSPEFSNLAHLEVCGSLIPSSVGISVVLDILRTIPLLETLHLENCIILASHTASTSEPLVMDHLSHLHLDSFSFELLWHIKFYALASLKLHSSDIHSDAELSRLLDTITSHFAGMSHDQQFRTLIVEARHSFISMRGWTIPHFHDLHLCIPKPVQLDLAISWSDGSQQKCIEIMTTLLKPLPVVKLEQLQLHLGPLTPISPLLWPLEKWMALLSAAPVQCIRLHEPGETIITFFHALILHIYSGAPRFLPQLADIWIISTDFQSPVVGAPFFHVLVALLHQASMCLGESMEFELTIMRCSNISEDDVASLKKFITVDWDELDAAREDEEEHSVVDFADDYNFSEEEGEDI